jgi:MFS family permease
MNNERLWTKDFVAVWGINFLLTLIFYLLLVTIASYATTEFNASTSMAGLASGICIIGASIGRLMAGRVIGDKGSKKILLTGTVSFIITSALYFGAVSLPLLLINRFLHGFALGIASTATGTIMAQIIPHNRRGEGVGYYSLSAILATAAGPFIGILLIQFSNFKVIFLFNLILSLIGFGISLFVREPKVLSIPDQVKTGKNFQLSNFLEFKALPIAMVTFIISFAFSGVLTFMSFYTRQINLAEAASVFFLVYAFTIMVSRPFSGRLLDLKGPNIVVYPCLIIFAAGMFLLSHATHQVTLLLAGAVIGLGYGNVQSCAQAISIKIVPPHRLGLATSTYFIFYDLGLGVGPYILGFLIPFAGYRGLYEMMILVILAAAVLYYFFHGRKTVIE